MQPIPFGGNTNNPHKAPLIPNNLDLKQTSPVKCDKCKTEAFQECVILRKVSALMTETGKEGYLPIAVFMCGACGNVNDEFKPKELRSNLVS